MKIPDEIPPPPPEVKALADQVSPHARQLVLSCTLEAIFATREPNDENRRNSLILLLAYIAELERNARTNTL